jgi:ribosomal protein L11 methyltransferase
VTRRTYSRLVVPKGSADEAVLGLLVLHDPLGFETVGRDLVAFFRAASDARRAGERLRERRIGHSLITDIAEGDPLEAFRAASRPFAVGRRLWIDPGEPRSDGVPDGRVRLSVPATRAFGTGTHASTRLALEALEEELLDGRSVLDVGTGSGILALAAAGLGARSAVGLDVDAEAVFVARENVRRHAFADRVRLYAGSLKACAGKFDLVVANMLAGEILPEARRLHARAARRGRLLVSGVTRESERSVLGALRTGRWKLAGRHADDPWVSLCLERAS